LVNPVKVTRSWQTNEIGVDQRLVIEAQPQIRTAHATVLGKANATMGRKFAGGDLLDGCFHQLTEFLPLFLCNEGS
jgi:hypothetical protein